MGNPNFVFSYLSPELIYLIEDLDLSLTFGELVDEIIELNLDPGRNAYNADPGPVFEPFVLFHRRARCNIAIGLGSKIPGDLDGKPELLEPYRENGAQGLDRLLNLFVEMFEGIDVYPRLFHGHLDALRRVRVAGLRVDRIS